MLAPPRQRHCSKHAGNELVDKLFAVAPGATILEGVSLLLETLKRGRELEGPQEVVGLLEVGSNGPELVNEVLNGVNSVLAENGLNDGIVGERNSGSVDLSKASLIDKSTQSVTGGVAIGDQGLDSADHVPGGLVQTHKHTVVQLAESQELHDLLGLGGKLVDTKKNSNETLNVDRRGLARYLPTSSDYKGNFWLTFNKEVTSSLCLALGVNESLVSSCVLLGVLLSVGSSSGSLGGALLLCSFTGSFVVSQQLGVSSALLLDVFGDDSCPKTNTNVMLVSILS